MGTEKLKLSPALKPETKLWRYMSLDKFIDILSTKEIYFSPLSSYSKSDPFEGIMPKVAMNAIAEIMKTSEKKLREMTNETMHFLEEKKSKGELIDPLVSEKYDSLISQVEDHLPFMERAYFKIMQAVTVSCWHMNEFESEGMWRLYSETNKGIAIQTNISRLIESIYTEKHITVSEVKYLDFHDGKLTPKDCVHNGNLVPFLKRNAFAHENEVRLAITPTINPKNIDTYIPQGIRVSIDPLNLIEKVYISPYAPQPYANSIYAIAEKFHLNKRDIIESKLLTVDESFTRLF